MKRILIISTNFPPSSSIGTKRILRICKYLDPNKWSVTILTQKKKYYGDFEEVENEIYNVGTKELKVYRTHKIDLFQLFLKIRERLRAMLSGKPAGNKAEGRTNRSPAEQNQNINLSYSEQVKRKKSTGEFIKDAFTDLLQFPDKQIGWLPSAVMKGYRIIKKDKVDIILTSSPPHSLHLISYLLKRLTGKKLVLDFRDPWARSPWHDEERNLNRFERWKHKIIIFLEKIVVSQADHVLLITEKMRDDFIKHYPSQPQEKFQYFPNGFDPEHLSTGNIEAPNANIREKKITFIHAGSLYKYRDPTPIFKALQKLSDQKAVDEDRIEFVFIGGVTDDKSHISMMPKSLGIDRMVTFLPRVSYERVMEYMNDSDVLVLIQPHTTLQLPGKFFDYLCLGKPILAVAEQGSASEQVIADKFGVFADFNDIDHIARGILFLYENPTYNVEKILIERDVYDMSKSIQRLEDILNM